MITLDIVSDPICPWCYIGKHKLDLALAELGSNPFDISWRMFRLNPDMPPEGVDRRTYLEGKFGGPEGAARVYGQIAAAGEAAGLSMKLDDITRTPATLDAHRLIHWARATGNQTAVVQQLFSRYFERGEDISDHAVLLDTAESACMERPVIERLLSGDADRDVLEKEEAAARETGITGVPCFIIGGRYVLQGAQDTGTWKRVIGELGALTDTTSGGLGIL